MSSFRSNENDVYILRLFVIALFILVIVIEMTPRRGSEETVLVITIKIIIINKGERKKMEGKGVSVFAFCCCNGG